MTDLVEQPSEIEEFAALVGLTNEQAGDLSQICSRRPDGKWLHEECGTQWLEVLDARALAGLFLFDERAIWWIAETRPQRCEDFNRIRALIEESPALLAQVQRFVAANGCKEVRLRTGARLKFSSSIDGGRGSTADVLVRHGLIDLRTWLPCLMTAPNPQIVGSSAGLSVRAW